MVAASGRRTVHPSSRGRGRWRRCARARDRRSRNTSHSVSNVQRSPRCVNSTPNMSKGTASRGAASRSATNPKRASRSMNRRMSHADAMRSTPGRGRVTHRRPWYSAARPAARDAAVLARLRRASRVLQLPHERHDTVATRASEEIDVFDSRQAAPSTAESHGAGCARRGGPFAARRGGAFDRRPTCLSSCSACAGQCRVCRPHARGGIPRPAHRSTRHRRRRPRIRWPVRRHLRSPSSATRNPRARQACPGRT